MSNMGSSKPCAARGSSYERRSATRYVNMEERRAGGYSLGGEQSGHLVFLDHATTRDGVVAALRSWPS